MLTLSKRVEYGLIAVLHMAALRSGAIATAKEIAEAYSIPAELLGKVLQSLSRAKLIASFQGAHGGYHLQRPLDQVTLGEVIEAVEGPVLLTACQEDPGSCGQFHACNIKEPVQQIHQQLIKFIHGVSLAAFRPPAGHAANLQKAGYP